MPLLLTGKVPLKSRAAKFSMLRTALDLDYGPVMRVYGDAIFALCSKQIDRIGYGLFTPISSHVMNLLIKLLLISLTYFVPCKVVP